MSEAPSAVLSVRVSAEERELLQHAAAEARTSLSDFVRRQALAAAELAILDRHVVTIPAADWEKFEAWVNGPAEGVPELRKLAAMRPAWRD